MKVIELAVSADGYVMCPRRGEIDVEWCLGCPRCRAVLHDEDRMVIACVPGTDHWVAPVPGPLRDVPPMGMS